MQTRVIFDLINGKTIEGDWQTEAEAVYIRPLLNRGECNFYYASIEVEGQEYFIMMNAVSGYYIQKRDEKKEVPF